MGLRPNRSLLNPNFEGYRLCSSTSQSIVDCELDRSPRCVQLSEKFYSYQLVRTFSSWNYLVQDPFSSPTSCYFVDENFSVIQCCVGDSSVRTQVALSIPHTEHGCDARQCFPPGIVFTAAKSSVVSDGCGQLFIVSLDRREGGACSWSVTHTYTHGKPFLLLDAVESSSRCLQCAVLVFDEVNAVDATSGPITSSTSSSSQQGQYPFTIRWFTLDIDAGTGGQLTALNAVDFASHPVPLYAGLTATGHGLCVLSEGRYRGGAAMSGQQQTTPSQLVQAPSAAPTAAPTTALQPKMPLNWQQTSDSVTVSFQLDDDVRSRDMLFSLSSTEVSLGLQDGLSFLRGQLMERVDIEASTWTIEDHVLELHLGKYQPGKQWSSLLKDASKAEEESLFPLQSVEHLTAEEKEKILRQMDHLTSDKPVTDADLAERDPMLHKELEECDKEVDNDHYLLRYARDGRILQQTSVTSNQWLFNARLDSSAMLAVCLRCDVDACVWCPTDSSPPCSSSAFQCQHMSTFNALGYVAASKQQKKFIACPRDASYSVICEYSQNVFLYYPEPDSSGQSSNTALQAIFNLPPTDESVVGVIALPALQVLLLTEKHLYLLKV